MGGKGGGGGGGGYYMQPTSTTGYGTPEEAKATLAREAPLDMSQYQQTINTKRAASEATAPAAPPPVTDPGGSYDIGSTMADTILQAPGYWTAQNKQSALKPRPVGKSNVVTTQT